MRPGRRLPALAAAGLLLTLAAGCAGDGEPTSAPAPAASPSSGTTSDPASDPASDPGDGASGTAYPVVELSLAAASGRCAVPTAARLALADGAWSGTVTQAGDGVVVVETSYTWTGRHAGTVELDVLDDALVADALHLRVGDEVLLAASGSQAMVCGYSGPRTRGLARLYERAFGSDA
ncbi:hypothetical protein [Nocardioides sp. GY 10127]|uniref:hypothetical protein n=1 Tax=Nocardioides sp. GY 10127 TaxID=2569762 RepID=UPI0010A929A7|nr:hypothetical protein [Nocardioides sp. GY 10127]TIC81949.1 hypothetical protein E8D37_12390 [Nocardioides sp. GY 10127]